MDRIRWFIIFLIGPFLTWWYTSINWVIKSRKKNFLIDPIFLSSFLSSIMSSKAELHHKLNEIGYELGPFAFKDTLSIILRLHSMVRRSFHFVLNVYSIGCHRQKYKCCKIRWSWSSEKSHSPWSDRWTCDK
jgi:hypothetical protein